MFFRQLDSLKFSLQLWNSAKGSEKASLVTGQKQFSRFTPHMDVQSPHIQGYPHSVVKEVKTVGTTLPLTIHPFFNMYVLTFF